MNFVRRTVLGLLASCLLGIGVARAEVTVLGWPGGPEEVALRAAVEAYDKTAPDADKVKLIFFNRDNFWDKLQTDLAASTSEFDVNLTATYAIGRYAPFMQPIDLPPAAHDSFSDGVLKTMQFGGKQYGVPTDLSLHFMYYRTDLIQKLLSDPAWQAKYTDIAKARLGQALAPKQPDQWTWNDYAATALFFTRSINPASPTRYGTVLQMKNLLFNMMVWQSLPRSYGGNWTDAAGHLTIDGPAYRTGLQLYKMLYDAGASPKDSLSYEYPEANAAFGSGQVATMLQWNAAYPDLNDTGKNPVVAGKIGTVAPPAGPDGRFTHIHALGLGLNAHAAHKAEAMRFLDWLASPAAMAIYATAGGSPALQPALVETLAKQRPDLRQIGTFAGQYGFVMNGGTSAKTLQIYELQAKEFTGYWAGTQSLDAALAHVASGMADLLHP